MLRRKFHFTHTHSFHAIKFVSWRIVKWKISASYLLCRSLGSGVGSTVCTIHSLCHVLNLPGMWPRSVFYLYAKYSEERLQRSIPFTRFTLFRNNVPCFHALVSLTLLPWASNVKHVQFWIYSVAKLYDSGHFRGAEKKEHHTFFRCCLDISTSF